MTLCAGDGVIGFPAALFLTLTFGTLMFRCRACRCIARLVRGPRRRCSKFPPRTSLRPCLLSPSVLADSPPPPLCLLRVESAGHRCPSARRRGELRPASACGHRDSGLCGPWNVGSGTGVDRAGAARWRAGVARRPTALRSGHARGSRARRGAGAARDCPRRKSPGLALAVLPAVSAAREHAARHAAGCVLRAQARQRSWLRLSDTPPVR